MPIIAAAAGLAARYAGARLAGGVFRKGMTLLGKGRGRVLKTKKKKTGLLKKVALGATAAVGGYVAAKGIGAIVKKIRGGGEGKGRKRIDPTNVKALRRATSRLASFSKTMRRVQSALNKLSTKKGYRPHSEGVITSSEARRALRR